MYRPHCTLRAAKSKDDISHDCLYISLIYSRLHLKGNGKWKVALVGAF